MSNHSALRDQRGIIALILVILVGSLTIVLGLSVALMAIDEMGASSTQLQSLKARNLTATCVDNALALLRNNTSLSGNVNVSLGNVNCISTIAGSGNTRTIVSNATSTDAFSRDVTDRVNVNININTNPFTIIEYKDILD